MCFLARAQKLMYTQIYYILYRLYTEHILNIINAHNRYPHHPYRNKIKRTWTGMSQNVGWGVGRALRFHTMSFCVLAAIPKPHLQWQHPPCTGVKQTAELSQVALAFHPSWTSMSMFWIGHCSIGCHYLSWPAALAATQMVPARIAESFPNKKKRLASRHIPEWGTFLGVLKSRPRLVRWCIVNINAKQTTQKTRYCEGPW